MTDPFVVVGGDAAGLSAASKARRTDPDREVIVFERGQWVSYAHCGMPYYVEGKVDDLLDLTSLSPSEVEERGIALRRGHEVLSVDTDARTVAVEGPDGRFEQPYGDLLLATGAEAVTGPFPVPDLDGAFTVHDMDHAAAMRAYLADPDSFDPDSVDGPTVDRALVARYGAMDPPERAAVVGGGYVGIEMAEVLTARGLDVHLFQRGSRVLPPFGEAVGERVGSHLEEQGVTLHTDTPVEGLRDDGDGGVSGVDAEGVAVDAGLVVVGVGVRPAAELAVDAGIATGDSGAVAVDDYGRTSADSVYAAGDCAEARHVVTGDPDWVPLGLTANRAGRAVGATVAGDLTETGGIAGTAVVKAFDLECGRTGLLAEAAAMDAGFDPLSVTVTAGSRSGYYPGGDDTDVTLAADRDTGELLGGAIVGADRAAVRIDTVATALESGMTVGDLERADLAYAPPFSPVWDPVLVAAKVLNGKLD